MKKFWSKVANWIVKKYNIIASPWAILLNTVDIAPVKLLHNNKWMVLLGRKPGSKKYQLIGGFTDVTDESIIASAKRELFEESNISKPLKDFCKLGEFPIDDERYQLSKHSILTHLFTVDVTTDIMVEKASDDIEQLQWYSLAQFKSPWVLDEIIVKSHHKLIRHLINYYSLNEK